jgi:hypothetical protein
MSETAIKELTRRLKEIHKLSNLSEIVLPIEPVTVNNNSVETKTVLKMMARMRGLEERIEALEKHTKIRREG